MPLRCQPSVGESQPLVIPSLAKEVSGSQKVTLLLGGGFKANEQTAVSAGGGLAGGGFTRPVARKAARRGGLRLHFKG